ncbi:unnamed protein product, partial [Amoebophrya sp. A120]|eukprot:GSA120T00013533001.1
MSTPSTGQEPLRGAAAAPVRRWVTGSTGAAAVPGAAGPAACTKIIFRVLGLLHFFDGRGGLFAPAWHQSKRTNSIFLAVQGLQLEKLFLKRSASSSSAPPGGVHLCTRFSGTPHQAVAERAGLQLLHTAAGTPVAGEHLQAAGESDTASQEPISSGRSAAVAAVPGEELQGPSAAPWCEDLQDDATAGVRISFLSLKQRTQLPILNLNGDTISHVSLPVESMDNFRKEFFENYLLGRADEVARTTGRDHTAGYAGAGGTGTSGTTAIKGNVGH